MADTNNSGDGCGWLLALFMVVFLVGNALLSQERRIAALEAKVAALKK